MHFNTKNPTKTKMDFENFIITISVPYSVCIISFLGLVANIINITILLSIKIKTDSQKIYLIWCILDIVYLSFCGIIDTISSATWNGTYIDCLINHYVHLLLTNILTFEIICIQLIYFYHNYLLILRKNGLLDKKTVSKIVVVGITMVAGIVIFSPLLFIWEINPDDEKFKVELTKFGLGFGTTYLSIVTVVQSMISILPLVMFNAMTYSKYKKVLIFSKSK